MTQPNIVLILSDDQGWSDFGFMGSDILQTPNIDALAHQGFQFSLGFNTASVCRASLRSILTGYYPSQYERRVASIWPEARGAAPASMIRHVETLPRLMAEQGYVSFQGGKYWEGSFRDGGFSAGLANGRMDPTSELDPLTQAAGGTGLELGRETMEPLFEFINENRERPFFVWFAPVLPHRPFDAPPQYAEPFVAAGLSKPAVGYYANISRLDERVGELVSFLDEKGLRDETLIVFLTDNGWEVGATEGGQQGTMGGARGKFSLHEMGFRTPLIMNWPGRIAARRDDEHLISTIDLFATLLELVEVDLPSDRWGKSFVSLLRGIGDFDRERVFGEVDQLRTSPGGAFPYLESVRGVFMRTRNWRYVRVLGRETEGLFQIDRTSRGGPMDDGLEAPSNVCSRQSDVCKEMREEMMLWQGSMTMTPPVGPHH